MPGTREARLENNLSFYPPLDSLADKIPQKPVKNLPTLPSAGVFMTPPLTILKPKYKCLITAGMLF